jgi:hypothetical protein
LKKEPVNHPGHYGGKDNQYEAIKVIEAWGLNFSLGNVLKYINRSGKKTEDPLRDLQKASQYLTFEIERLERVRK